MFESHFGFAARVDQYFVVGVVDLGVMFWAEQRQIVGKSLNVPSCMPICFDTEAIALGSPVREFAASVNLVWRRPPGHLTVSKTWAAKAEVCAWVVCFSAIRQGRPVADRGCRLRHGGCVCSDPRKLSGRLTLRIPGDIIERCVAE